MVTICEGYMALLGMMRAEGFLVILTLVVYHLYTYQYLHVLSKFMGKSDNIGIWHSSAPNVGSNFMTFSIFILVAGCYVALVRIRKRAWELCALLIVLWQKSSQIKELATITLESCFPPVIVEFLEGEEALKGDEPTIQQTQEPEKNEITKDIPQKNNIIYIYIIVKIQRI